VRVGIDYRPALLAKTGIGRYAEGLVRGLIELAPAVEPCLWAVFRRSGEVAHRLPPGVRARRWPLPGRLADRLGWLGYPPDRALGGCDVWHHTDFVVPRTRCPSVMTLHDVIFLEDDRWHGRARSERLAATLALATRRCARFLVPTEHVKRDVIARTPIDESRIRVVPPGVDAARFANAPPAGRARPYVLAVGSLEPRKNLPRLIAAFDRVAAERDDVELLIAGSPLHDADLVTRARDGAAASARVHLLGRVDDAALASLYRGAAAFAYVSLREGFGLPVLEAMAAGVPVVTSAGTAMEEVACGAAALVDPESVDSIADGLLGALTHGPDKLTALVGEACVQRHTWARTARAALDVYSELV